MSRERADKHFLVLHVRPCSEPSMAQLGDPWLAGTALQGPGAQQRLSILLKAGLSSQESERAMLLSASIHHSLSILRPMPGWTEEHQELEWAQRAQPQVLQRWVFSSVCCQQLLQWCCKQVQSLKLWLRGFWLAYWEERMGNRERKARTDSNSVHYMIL